MTPLSQQVSMTRPTKTDRRLLGAWRSDRNRTLKEWMWRPRTSAAHRKLITEMFGHLTIRYTRQRIHIEFKGESSSQSYKILGADADTVAIMHGSSSGPSIQHIHFSGVNHYWITIGRQREWFKRRLSAKQH